ncbi:unnamed protein product, partial [Amoebophrya sp. A25]
EKLEVDGDDSLVHEKQGDSWYSHTLEKANGQRQLLQMDVVGGTFLVDGAPCGRLPDEIVNHPDYTRIFQRSIFSVHPVGSGLYKTSAKLNGAT